MATDSAQRSPAPSPGFTHEAYVYDDDRAFVRGTADFVRAGVDAREAVVVACSAETIERLRAQIGDFVEQVDWIDVTDTGRNPARMIPLWRELLGRYSAAGRPVRAVGMLEPIRSEAQLAEDVLNEALLNLAFEHAADFRLRCPYDARSTPPELLGCLDKTHPVLVNGAPRHSAAFAPAEVASSTFRSAPPPAPEQVERWPVTLPELGGIRERVWRLATGHGLDKDRADDAVLATHEICKNSIRFGGGGTLAVWTEDHTLICEVADSGHIDELMVGRSLPSPTAEGGRGLWLANQLCDLVQVRSTETGTVVRLHVVR